MNANDRKGLEALVKLWTFASETSKRQAEQQEKGHLKCYTLGEAAGLKLAAKQLSEFLK